MNAITQITQIIGFWFLAVCFLFVGSLFVGVSIKESKLVRLFPLWVVAYCLSLASITPLIWFRWWEGPEGLIMIIWMLVTLSFAGLIIASLVVAIIKKRYGVAIGMVAMGIFLFIYSVLTMTFIGLGAGDNFGKRHPIPAGMEYYTTGITAEYGNANAQAYLDSLVIERGIVMVDYGQPGQYRYMAYVPAIPEKGEIYLKLYEATTDFRLSEYIKYNTTIKVEASDTAVIYRMESDGKRSMETYNTQYFTIEEGSWGDYYAARVELWYKPESSDEEKLLHSVIYKVEGWSR